MTTTPPRARRRPGRSASARPRLRIRPTERGQLVVRVGGIAEDLLVHPVGLRGMSKTRSSWMERYSTAELREIGVPSGASLPAASLSEDLRTHIEARLVERLREERIRDLLRAADLGESKLRWDVVGRGYAPPGFGFVVLHGVTLVTVERGSEPAPAFDPEAFAGRVREVLEQAGYVVDQAPHGPGWRILAEPVEATPTV